jgi:hypothetical protein
LFYGDDDRRKRAVAVLRKMRSEGKHPLSKVPHLGIPDLDNPLYNRAGPLVLPPSSGPSALIIPPSALFLSPSIVNPPSSSSKEPDTILPDEKVSVKDQRIIENNAVLKNENNFQNEKNSKDTFIKKSLLDIEVIKVEQERKASSMDNNDELNNSTSKDPKIVDNDVTMLITIGDRALEAQGVEETDSEYLVRTCKYCKEEKESQQLEGLLHCDGIWLHALRYQGTGWGFQAPTPSWAVEEHFEIIVNKLQLKCEGTENDLSLAGGSENPRDII